MPLLFGRDDWWLCDDQDCNESDRASALEIRAWIHWWLQDLQTNTGKMWLLQDLVRKNISAAGIYFPHDAFIRKIEQLFACGRLHLHKKHLAIESGSSADKSDVAFPLANHQPRIASQPAPVADVPIFSPKLNMSAQAATLVAAAASGAPFCQE